MATTGATETNGRAALVVGTRLHWNNHARDEPIDVAALLHQVLAFCARAASYADAGVLIAIGVPDGVTALPSRSTGGAVARAEPRSAFAASVLGFLDRLYADVDSGVLSPAGKRVPVEIIPLLHWGKFVPALNALVATASTASPSAALLLLQSLEIDADASAVQFLRSHFDTSRDLVVGAALPGHEFSPGPQQPLELTGTTSPWNTLALWNLRQLSKVGFPLVGDGLHLGDGNAGIEEVSTIALFQRLFASTADSNSTRATMLRVPGIAWQVDGFEDPARRAWQAAKMASKNQRAATQMQRLGIPAGRVFHVETVSE